MRWYQYVVNVLADQANSQVIRCVRCGCGIRRGEETMGVRPGVTGVGVENLKPRTENRRESQNM